MRSAILSLVAKRFPRNLVPIGKNDPSFPGSKEYWERRYAAGANSGAGSYSHLAEFKAAVINSFVAAHNVNSVIEFGCGDGNQLRLAEYPSYFGLDVSKTAIEKCRELFKSDNHKSFALLSDYARENAELALSLDVIYHLVEDHVFEQYMRTLFEASSRYVIIYSSNTEGHDDIGVSAHVRHRKFTGWIEKTYPQWKLLEHVPNQYPYEPESGSGSFADFFIFESTNTSR
jgi:SAM-dependent methyltransferase